MTREGPVRYLFYAAWIWRPCDVPSPVLGLSRCPLCPDQAWLFLEVPVSSQALASFPRVSLIADGLKGGVVGTRVGWVGVGGHWGLEPGEAQVLRVTGSAVGFCSPLEAPLSPLG